MDKEEFEKYLKERYEFEVDWYDRKSIKNKKIAYALRVIIIILSAIVPILAALQFVNRDFTYLTIVIGSIVSIATGLLGYGKFEDLWHNYRTTCETLRKEKYFYNCRCGDYSQAADPERLFVERVESLISKENTQWVSTIKECKKDKNDG